MFDDPKKELQELENQLLAAEMNHEAAELNNEEFEELYDGILEEFGPREAPGAAAEPVPAAEPPIRNFANGYGSNPVQQPLGHDGDEILDDDEPAVPEKSSRGLVILACMECLAIAGLAVYWFFHFL